VTAPPDHDLRPAPLPLWRRALRALWLVAVAAALVFVLRDRGPQVVEAFGRFSLAGLGAAGLLLLAAVGVSVQIWRVQLAALGSPLRARPALRVFFVGQVGKYLPGSVWPVLAQMEMGRELAVPARVSAAAFGLFMLVYLLTGVLVAALALPLAGLVPVWWAAAGLAALVLLFPGPLNAALRWAVRVLRRDPLPALPAGAAMLRSALWALLVWVLAGLHLWVLARDLGLPVDYLGALGAFAGAWVAGFLLLVAPAGAGAREAVLVALLAPLAGTGPALALALASRVLGTAADALWALVGVASGVRRSS
jgi:uncharacterized membrane protein YbhN (UPF0104 family)